MAQRCHPVSLCLVSTPVSIISPTLHWEFQLSRIRTFCSFGMLVYASLFLLSRSSPSRIAGWGPCEDSRFAKFWFFPAVQPVLSSISSKLGVFSCGTLDSRSSLRREIWIRRYLWILAALYPYFVRILSKISLLLSVSPSARPLVLRFSFSS